MSVTELAEAAGASEATVVRLFQELDYRGYQDFKIQLSKTMVPASLVYSREIAPSDPPGKIMENVFNMSMLTLRDTRQVIQDEVLEQAVTLLAGAARIEFVGFGGSGVVARDGYHKFIRLGIPVHATQDAHDAAQICSLLGTRDVVVAISHSGSSRDLLESVRLAQGAGAKVIALTRFGRSPLQKLADVVLNTLSPETSYRSEGIASRIAQLAIIDTLLVAVFMRQCPGSQDRLERAREALKGKRL